MTSGWMTVRPSQEGWRVLLIGISVFLLNSAALAQDARPAKNVLVLYSFSDPNALGGLESLKSAIRAQVRFPVNFYAEYMDSQRFEDAAYEKSVSDSFRSAYGELKLDLVMVAAYPALRFVLRHRDEIFPGVPVVFFYIHHGRIQDGQLPSGFTGVTTTVDIRGTLDLAFRVDPATRHVAVVTGTTEFETYCLELFRHEFRSFEDRAKLTALVGLPPDQLLHQLSALPSDTAVFVQLIPQPPPTLPAFASYDATYRMVETIGQRYRTYCIFSRLCLDRGGVGGGYYSDRAQVEGAAAIASRILDGEKPESIPIAHQSETQIRVDWRQLRRWNISESALPPGTLVLYREPTLWQRYQTLIIGLIVFIVLQAVLIAGLLRQRARKKRTEATLVESEERFRTLAEAAPAMIWMSNQAGKITYLNKKSIEFAGVSEELPMDDWISYIHTDDLPAIMTARSRAIDQHEGVSLKCRLRRRDGSFRWMLYFKTPRFCKDGTFAGFVGSAVDISDQQTAQDALEKLGGRLIAAQEQERGRIARELHDDICQRLAILTVEIEQSMNSGDASGDQEERIQKVWQHCSEIAGDVQSLSHELHSSMLDHLGVVAAIRNFCSELSAKQGVTVNFIHADVPSSLPRNVSLCLFRVTQEALHNAVKHSGVRCYEVKLRGVEDRVDLEIRDAGVGLDLDRVGRNGGLGLISMEERVHLVKGTFAIDSKINGGTTIRASVPLSAQLDEGVHIPVRPREEETQDAAHSSSAG